MPHRFWEKKYIATNSSSPLADCWNSWLCCNAIKKSPHPRGKKSILFVYMVNGCEFTIHYSPFTILNMDNSLSKISAVIIKHLEGGCMENYGIVLILMAVVIGLSA